MNAIEINDLQFLRQKRTIFSGFNVELKQGQFIALLGPNGTGKSTLLKLMSGILPANKGNIKILDSSLKNLKSIERAKYISYMPQFSLLQTPFTVEQVVSMGRYPHKKRFSNWSKEDQAIVEKSMRLAEIEHLKDRLLPNLSGGERQLVYLAKAIAQDTPILLLDEPTSDLDVYHQIIVTNVLKKLQRDGKTIVAAIHDINLAARISDECLVIKDGKIVSYGSQAEVIQPKTIKQAFNVNAHIYKEPFTETNQMLPYEVIK